MSKIKLEDFPQIIEIYNTAGRTEAYDYIRSNYAVKNPYFVLKRIKEASEFAYDEQNDKFVPSVMNTAEICFMNLDSLCNLNSPESTLEDKTQTLNDRNTALNAMITNLISDRLLELSRYVSIDPVSKTVRVDSLSIKENGYRMVIVS